MKSFGGRAVLITGASSGIGEALARRLAAEGARLAVAARRADRLEGLASELRSGGTEVVVVPADVGVEAEARGMVRRAVEQLGGLDVLVNNAGYGLTATVEELPLDRARQQFEVIVWGLIAATQEALVPMKAAGGGLIVNVGSVLGQRSLPTMASYCMTKFAVAAFSESARAELRDHGIHVLLAEPGLTRTSFGEQREIVGEHRRHFDDAKAMTAEQVADRIVRAARRRRDRVSMTASGRLMIWMNRLLPGLTNRGMEVGYRRGSFG